MINKKRMTIIVPVYNEIDNLKRIEKTFEEYLQQSDTASQVLFVDDGSTDCSLDAIVEICKKPEFAYLKFDNNSF